MSGRTLSSAVLWSAVSVNAVSVNAVSVSAIGRIVWRWRNLAGRSGGVFAGMFGMVLAFPAAAAPPPETGCRQTNALTAIYVQPSLESSSRGLVASGQSLRLEVSGSGSGWARVTEPLIGWIEAKYLTPPTACSGFAPAVLPARPAQQAASASPAVTCDVLPVEGLIVRSEPTTTSGRVLQTIPKGTYQFQFTRDHVRSHSGETQRDWAYITSPYEGWIALGIVGGQFNLGGKTCG